MANARYPTSGCIGANVAAPIPAGAPWDDEIGKQFQDGLASFGDANTQWAVGTATEAVAAGTCTFNPTTFAITDAAGNYTAPVALATGQQGWVYLTAGANP